MLKSAKDFGGYWLKAVKTYKGHEGEPLFQGKVYLNNKKIGFFAAGDFGGPPSLQNFSEEDEKVLHKFAAEYADSYFEPEATLFYDIMDEIEIRQSLMRKCRTKTLVRINSQTALGYFSFNVKYKENGKLMRKHLDKKYGPGNYKIINEELRK